MADCFLTRRSSVGTTKNISFEFDMSRNILTDINVTSNFKIEKSGQQVLITVPANLATAAWIPIMSSTINLKLNYMYYIRSVDYNGYGRIGLCNTISTSRMWVFEQAGKNAFGYFPCELMSPYRDGDNHVIRDDYHEAWFYLPTTDSNAYATKTSPFALWFCGDKLHNGARDSFTFSIELYEQKKIAIT